ncbi:MAG: polysaccharide biosynthesis protein [Rhodocyclales bacterium]|nr:polysaccharide biosynthesis protein [Rhodocyclales bacterium]
MIARNLLANALGSVWTALASFIFVPVYLHYIGAEGYGLIGFFAVLTSFVSILDGGISALVSRELAPLAANPTREERNAAVELVRSLQALLWSLSVLVAGALWLLAPWLAEHWLKPKAVTVVEATTALRWMSVAFLMQWPSSLCGGCLIALQRQVRLNYLNSAIATLRFGGAALVLWLISPELEAFFIWQAIASAMAVIALSLSVRQALYVQDADLQKISWSLNRLRMSGRFAFGVAGINFLAMILGQLDKVLLSAMLPLEAFGIYTLASTMAALIYKFSSPIYNAVYPVFVILAKSHDVASLAIIFRKSSQLTALAMTPVAMVIACFSKEILYFWTQNSQTAEHGHWVLTALALGALLGATVWLPYGLQLAHQWVRLTLRLNVACVTIVGPLLYLLTLHFGVVGAAAGWLLFNFAYVQISGVVSLLRLLPGELLVWYWRVLCLPLLVSYIVCGGFALILPDGHNKIPGIWLVPELALVWLISSGLTFMVLPEIKADVMGRLSKYFAEPRQGI